MLACETPMFNYLIVLGGLNVPNYVNQLNVFHFGNNTTLIDCKKVGKLCKT